MKTVTGTIELTAGSHPLVVLFFEKGGGANEALQQDVKPQRSIPAILLAVHSSIFGQRSCKCFLYEFS
eukprot:737491-Amphidinium_carterae.1